MPTGSLASAVLLSSGWLMGTEGGGGVDGRRLRRRSFWRAGFGRGVELEGFQRRAAGSFRGRRVPDASLRK